MAPRVSALLAICLTAAPVGAVPLLVGANWDIHNTTGQEATGIHIETDLTSPGVAPIVLDHFDDLFSTFNHTVPGGGPDFTLTADWNDDLVLPGEQRHVGLYLLLDGDLAMRNLQASWTQGGVPLAPGAPVPGFAFDPLGGGDWLYTIYNDSTSTITVSQLQLNGDASFVPLNDLLPNTLPGFDPPLPDFDLPPGGWTSLVLSGGGDFMLAEGEVFDTASGDLKVSFAEIAQIPEPSTLALLLLLTPLTTRRRCRG